MHGLEKKWDLLFCFFLKLLTPSIHDSDCLAWAPLALFSEGSWLMSALVQEGSALPRQCFSEPKLLLITKKCFCPLLPASPLC